MRFLIVHPNTDGINRLIETGLERVAPKSEKVILTNAEQAAQRLKQGRFDLVIVAARLANAPNAPLQNNQGAEIVDFMRSNKKFGYAQTPVIVIDDNLGVAGDLAFSRDKNDAKVFPASVSDLVSAHSVTRAKFDILVELALCDRLLTGSPKQEIINTVTRMPPRPSVARQSKEAAAAWAKSLTPKSEI